MLLAGKQYAIVYFKNREDFPSGSNVCEFCAVKTPCYRGEGKDIFCLWEIRKQKPNTGSCFYIEV